MKGPVFAACGAGQAYQGGAALKDAGPGARRRALVDGSAEDSTAVPGLYSWGFNDETCPPTSMYAAYNVISAPKRLMLAYDTGHRTTQEQVDDVDDWVVGELTGRGTTSADRRD